MGSLVALGPWPVVLVLCIIIAIAVVCIWYPKNGSW